MTHDHRAIIGLALVIFLADSIRTSPAEATNRDGSQNADRPNVILIIADDHRADHLGCAGRNEIDTPAIDRLAARGVRFDRAYCQGSTSPAVCLPSRSRLISGRNDWTTPNWQRAHGRADFPLWPEVLRSEGWRTHHIGKWHCGRSWFDRCFDDGSSVFFGGMGSHRTLPVVDIDAEGNETQRRLADYSSDEFADQAVAFIDAVATDDDPRPFVLSLSFTAPHDPRTPPAGQTTIDARAARIELPPNVLPVHPFDNGEMTIRDEELLSWPRRPRELREEIARYDLMIENMDAGIGRVLEALDRQALTDDTVIIFAGDHGLALGSHGLLGKQNLYEHSMRSPLIVVGPGFPAGTTRNDFTYLHDIPATILAAAGLAIPDSMDGLDLHLSTERNDILTRYRQIQRAWRDDRWKIIWYPKIDRWQVFDLLADPEETVDLARDPANTGLVADLRRRLQAARRENQDTEDLLVERPDAERFDSETAETARLAKDHWKRP